MKPIAIYGAGGLGREVASLINRINNLNSEWDLIGFFDDTKSMGEQISHFGPCLGGIEQLNAWGSELSVVLAFGYPLNIELIYNKIKNPLIVFPNIIHPSFFVSDPKTFKIGIGNIITYDCAVTTNVSIGNFNVLNGEVGIGHDSIIGNFNVFMSRVAISGTVKIGNKNLFGVGAFVKEKLIIGNNITLSPLSALLTKPKDGKTYIGNPARKFEF